MDHFVDSIEGFTVGMEVELVVDAQHRRRGTLLHSGGHLVAEAGQIASPGLKAVAGHHWDGEARVEFVGPAVDEDFRDRLVSVLADLIRRDLPISLVGDPFAARAIRIGAFDPVPCGGTHALATGELGSLVVTKIKRSGDRLRVSYTL
jgi:Ser-tRNA(Ala) deacylase AlaX